MADTYYSQNSPYSDSSYREAPRLPLHLCFFLFTLLLFICLSWYLSYESAFEGVVDNFKLFLVVLPLLLLLAVHCLSGDGEGGWVSFLSPLPERDGFHRAGGSPWGVGLVLVLLMFMISYQSYFTERWFPLLSRR